MMENYNRDSIKRRMLSRISTLWDIEDTHNIDPIIRIMIESLSEEIFRLSGEMNNLDDRLISKLSASLTPVEYITPRPCHSLMSARGYDATLRIDQNVTFTYNESKIVRRYNLDKLDFIPVSPFTLIDGALEYLSVGGRIYKSLGGFRKSLISIAQHSDKTLSSSVWIAINPAQVIGQIDELSIYFDFVDTGDKYKYLDLLSLSKASVGGSYVNSFASLPQGEVQAEYLQEPIERVLSDIRTVYNKHYLTLTNIDATQVTNFPQELEQYYTQEDVQGFKEQLLWIKIEFTDAIPENILDKLKVGINIFPVANISHRKVSQNMSDVNLFLPLETSVNEFFVAINQVNDSSGEIYYPIDRHTYMNSDRQGRVYTLRKGGVEQYSNTNDTISTVSRLVDILKDRNLFNNTRIEKEFSQTMSEAVNLSKSLSAMLENSSSSENQLKSYILVEKSNSRDILTAQYYTTNGATIANFRPTETLISDIDTQINREFSEIITPTVGGYNDPSSERIKDIHRYLLTSSDRIFTAGDIRNFIHAEYSGEIKSIDIQNGSMVSNKPSEGIVSTIDISIILKEGSLLRRKIENLKIELISKLENRSPESFKYRVKIS